MKMNKKTIGIVGIALLAIVGVAVYTATADPYGYAGYGMGYGMGYRGYGGYGYGMPMGMMGMPMGGMMGYSKPMMGNPGWPSYSGYQGYEEYGSSINRTDNETLPQYPYPQYYGYGHCPMMGW
jgi:hypothetical protein